MTNNIALGSAMNSCGKAVIGKPNTTEEKISALQAQVKILSIMFNEIRNDMADGVETDGAIGNVNTDGIPIGIELLGTSLRSGIRTMTVQADGYYIGFDRFDSLSAAAEAASGVRRSGWTFWKLQDGRTVKEAFRRG